MRRGRPRTEIIDKDCVWRIFTWCELLVPFWDKARTAAKPAVVASEREERAKRVQKNFQAEQRKFAEDQKKHLLGTPKYERTPAKMMANVFISGMRQNTCCWPSEESVEDAEAVRDA
ncbi:hypothetical protein niasHT_030443 [Heterodera trifolii]|uniref:Uncharacterized protein n=1 Tax=Heterodera trifolii TaxID=157864 RepID=A0ABD2J1N5_9BILA